MADATGRPDAGGPARGADRARAAAAAGRETHGAARHARSAAGGRRPPRRGPHRRAPPVPQGRDRAGLPLFGRALPGRHRRREARAGTRRDPGGLGAGVNRGSLRVAAAGQLRSALRRLVHPARRPGARVLLDSDLRRRDRRDHARRRARPAAHGPGRAGADVSAGMGSVGRQRPAGARVRRGAGDDGRRLARRADQKQERRRRRNARRRVRSRRAGRRRRQGRRAVRRARRALRRGGAPSVGRQPAGRRSVLHVRAARARAAARRRGLPAARRSHAQPPVCDGRDHPDLRRVVRRARRQRDDFLQMECDTTMTSRTLAALAASVITVTTGCSAPPQGGTGDANGAPPPASAPATAAPAAPATKQEEPAEALPPPTYEVSLPEELRGQIDKPFTADLDGMIKRRIIRVGVTFNRTFYFIDKGTQRGLSYEYATLFEDALNKKLNTGNIRVHVVLLPLPRDVLLPALQQGKIDMVVAQLTVTPSRQKLVDFTDPTRRDISEV